MPPATIYVGRPSRWGNRWTLEGFEAAGFKIVDRRAVQKICVDAYAAWLKGEPHWAHGAELPPVPDLEPLRGYDLACWCPIGEPCHADLLLDFANAADRRTEICAARPSSKGGWPMTDQTSERAGDSDFDPTEGDEEAEDFECSMGPDGQCGAAGTEWCDFACPVMADLWEEEFEKRKRAASKRRGPELPMIKEEL